MRLMRTAYKLYSGVGEMKPVRERWNVWDESPGGNAGVGLCNNKYIGLWEHEREELRSDVLLPEFVNVKTLTAWKSRSDWE